MNFENVVVLAMGILCWVNHRKAKKRIAKMEQEQIEEVCRRKDKGEAVFNILSTIYLSIILFLLDYDNITTQIIVSVFICMLIMFITLNVRIYMYKVKIRELQKGSGQD